MVRTEEEVATLLRRIYKASGGQPTTLRILSHRLKMSKSIVRRHLRSCADVLPYKENGENLFIPRGSR